MARTFFPDETVIAIVGVVGISKTAMGILKLEEFVTVLS